MTKIQLLRLITIVLSSVVVALVLFTENRGVRVVLSSSAGGSVPLSRTGAPLGFGNEPTCLAGGCHQVGPLAGESLNIEIRDSTNTQVVSGYQPGQSYKVNVTHTPTGTGWGFQITAIDPTLVLAGNMSAADGTVLSDRFNNGREYTNHMSPNVGNWAFNWTAPASNVGTVAFYAAGVRITGSGNLNDRVYTAVRTLAASTPGTLQFSSATYSQAENGVMAITVTRAGGSSGAASVQFSSTAGGTATGGGSCTPGVDYITPSGTLNWADGDASSKTFNVTLCNENIFEGTETVNLSLSNASGATLGGQTTATLSITNDDAQPSISINDVSQPEGNSGTTSFNFIVTLSNPSTQTVTVNYATANGTATAGSDYTAVGSTLTFNALETSKQVTVLITGETTFEPDETFFVNLSGASNATIADSQGAGTIVNDDGAPQPGTLQFSTGTHSLSENGGAATITVARTGGTSGAASVQFSNPAGGTATGGGSCIAGVDYVTPSGTLNWGDGDGSSKTFAVTICNDTVFEGNETVNLALSNATGATLGGQTTATLTINEDDPQPTISINDVSQSEGNSGTTSFNFTVSLSNASTQTVTVSYATANGTATLADNDYQAVGLTLLTFNPGDVTKPVTVLVNGDVNIEANETFFVNLTTPTNATIADAQGVGTINNDDSGPQTSSVQFSATNFTVNEGAGSATITVTRTGDTTGTATVNYKTTDSDTFTVGCSDAVNNLGGAFGRCDFATSLDTLTFAPGETSKSFLVPVINDAIAEGNETFGVMLSNATGAALGTPATATVTINDNETVTGSNPIFTTPFFVRQHYLDFLSREPEAGEPWSAILNNCSDVNNNPTCDRITVSSSFFRSPEYQLKAYFVFRFYKVAFNRLPTYSEIVVDMRAVTGQTPAEVFQKKAAFTNAFVLRTEFGNLYNALNNAQYVSTLMGRYSLTQITTPDPAAPDGTNKVTLTSTDLTNRLNGVGGTLTRAQVLRAIADSDQVLNLEATQAFVATQYYGYLQRTPDTAGYNAWLNHLNAHPTDLRTMVNGFMNSAEYRLRFGPP